VAKMSVFMESPRTRSPAFKLLWDQTINRSSVSFIDLTPDSRASQSNSDASQFVGYQTGTRDRRYSGSE
jgi:hypothetical protein